jgi:putative ABC transport system permease protein
MFKWLDLTGYTFERLWLHRVLVVWVLVGLSAATTLALSLPMYVDSVYSELLSARLGEPPLNYRFRYLGAWSVNIGRTDVENADAAVRRAYAEAVGLPLLQSVRYIKGGTWGVSLGRVSLGPFGVASLEGIEARMEITSGTWPPNPDPARAADAPIPVLVSETALFNIGLQVGDELTATRAGGGNARFVVAALWRPVGGEAASDDPSWIFPPKFFDLVLLVPPDDLWTVVGAIDNPIDEVGWQLIFDPQTLRANAVNGLVSRMTDGLGVVTTVLPRTELGISPELGLRAFSDEVNTLTQQLVIIILPVGGMILYFVSLLAGMLVSNQQAEDVKLRSRGISRAALLYIHVLMWLVLVLIALGIGVAASVPLVQLIAQTASFLRYDSSLPMPTVTITLQAVLIGGVVGLIAAGSGLWQAWRTTGQNINSFRQASARSGPAWWQRTYLDLLMLGVGVYTLLTLLGRGGLQTNAESAFNDPMTFLAPTLFSLGLAFLFLRLFPWLLRLLGGVIAYTNSVPILMALRELTRSIGRYRGALLMMTFTLSLIGFSSSMADAVDRSLVDTIHYRIGASAVLVTAVDVEGTQNRNAQGQTTFNVTGFNAPPILDLYNVDGIAAFSRVGRYSGRLNLRGARVEGEVLGVDRQTMAAVALARPDLSPTPLADLFNALATQRTGVLIDRATLEQYHLALGQELDLEITALNQWYSTRVPILGVLDYFPTYDPINNKGEFFLVTNLEPLFETVGTPLPYNVWAALRPGTSLSEVQREVAEAKFPVTRWEAPSLALAAAQAAPARRGVLGFLSVGFVAAMSLTLIAAIIQSVASFRAQSAQLGALRAMGLGGVPLALYMILLQVLSTGGSILCGTGIGVLTTLLFLPLMDFSGGLPPYLVQIDWANLALVYGIFATVLFGTTLVTTLFLSREQLTTVTRLGEG